MKKVFTISIVLGLFLATVLSGCGGSGGSGGVSGSKSAVVTTFAGTAGQIGSADGTGTDARFRYPDGIIADVNGNLYVADCGSHIIRKITPAGVVTTIAGSAGQSGSADGTGAGARFKSPSNITIDSAGNFYVSDSGNHTIRKITQDGEVSTFAGSPGFSGSVDGTGAAARFNIPLGITIDSFNNLFVIDRYNHAVRKITPAGVVTTIAGSAGESGFADGTGAAARFDYPVGIVIDNNDNLYVADAQNDIIRKITPAGVVTTIAGTADQKGSVDGTGAAARFNHPCGITIDKGNNLYIVDNSNHIIRKITPAGVVTTIAGTAGQTGSADGIGAAARFDHPGGITIDPSGNLYITDTDNHTIRKITFK